MISFTHTTISVCLAVGRFQSILSDVSGRGWKCVSDCMWDFSYLVDSSNIVSRSRCLYITSLQQHTWPISSTKYQQWLNYFGYARVNLPNERSPGKPWYISYPRHALPPSPLLPLSLPLSPLLSTLRWSDQRTAPFQPPKAVVDLQRCSQCTAI